MELVNYRPLMARLGMPAVFDRFFDDFFAPQSVREQGFWNPAVDILERDDAIVIQAELPGIDKKDITIDVKDRVLTLRGERATEHKQEKERYVRHERFFGRFERAFRLPADVDPEVIKADYTDGVLKIEIPKPADTAPKTITVH